MRIAAVSIAVAMFGAGCAAPTTQVILLPPPEGKTASAVDVNLRQGPVVLSHPYESAAAARNGGIKTQQMSASDVQRRYGVLLAEQPQAAEYFTLNFDFKSTSLTPESLNRVDEVLSSAARHAGGEIFVTGHTDSIGTNEANDTLSLQRAQTLRELFIQRGFDPALVHAIGRGKREPLVPTPDAVEEPRNRRVEIVVR